MCGKIYLFVNAIQVNDYNVVITLAFVFSLMYILVMLSVDVLYGIINPRIRVDKVAADIIKNVYKRYTKADNAELFIGKGGTYAGKLPNAVGTGICLLNGVEFPKYLEKGHGGPHQPDETLPIDAYIEGIKLLAAMIVNVDAGI